MAYKTEDLEKQALAVIKKDKYLFCIEDLCVLLPCGKKTFYNHNLHELPSIKTALENNKINVKGGLKKRWNANPNPTTDIVLYKLASTDEELNKLTSQKASVDHTGKIIIDFTSDD